MPVRSRNPKRRASPLPHSRRFPLGAPNNPQSKIQVLSRATPFVTDTLASDQDSLSVDDDSTGMACYMGDEDFRPMLTKRGRPIVDDNGPPRSSAPISLEDLVIVKPGRNRGHKGVKTIGTVVTEDDAATPMRDLVEPRESLNRIEKSPPMDCSGSQPFMKMSSQSFPWQSQPAAALEELDVSAERIEDGEFRQETLGNGDLSMYQWSEAHQKWFHLGLIGQSDVSLFTRFYDRAHADHHSNAESWKLYKEHIIAVIKQLSLQKRGTVHSDSQARPLVPDRMIRSLSNPPFRPLDEQRRTRSRNPESEETEHFPPLPTALRRTATASSEITTSGLETTNCDGNRQSQSQLLQNAAVGPASDVTGNYQIKYNRHNLEADETRCREVYGEFERDRFHQGWLAQNQPDRSTMMREISSPRSLPSEFEQFSRYSQPFAEPNLRSFPPKEKIYRRTVLHDPLKAALSSVSRARYPSGTALSPSAPYARTNKTAVHNSCSTLQQLVEISEPDPLPCKRREFIFRSDDSPARQFGCLPEADGFLRPHMPQEKCKPNRRLFNWEFKDNTPSRSYEKALSDFWHSGTKLHQSYESQIDRILARSKESSNLEAQIGIRALFPAYESIAAYQISRDVQAAGGIDYFARFSRPPSRCVDRVIELGKANSLFEGNEARQAQIQYFGIHRGLSAQGKGLQMPATSYG